MHHIALLRGINVGTTRQVNMKKLKAMCESLGYSNVSTYINSGNVLFESNKKPELLQKEMEKAIEKTFGFEVATLVKTRTQMQTIAKAIPPEWANDAIQRTDVAYLFPEIDSKKTIDELPIKKECVDIRYVKGALIWNIRRENVNKSHLNKVISHKYYKLMTVRNVNTARKLCEEK